MSLLQHIDILEYSLHQLFYQESAKLQEHLASQASPIHANRLQHVHFALKY